MSGTDPAPGPDPAQRPGRPAHHRDDHRVGGHRQPVRTYADTVDIAPYPGDVAVRAERRYPRRLLRDNPARYVEVPSPRRPHAQVWTAQRVEAWQQTGERPSVAVWTTEQTATFLTFGAQDRLAVMWWLIALRGLRRGEAAGLRWADVDLDAGVFMVEHSASPTATS